MQDLFGGGCFWKTFEVAFDKTLGGGSLLEKPLQYHCDSVVNFYVQGPCVCHTVLLLKVNAIKTEIYRFFGRFISY